MLFFRCSTLFDSLPRQTPRRPNGALCLSLDFLFQQLHSLWKCSRPLNIHRQDLNFPLRNELQANCFTSAFMHLKMWVARRTEKKWMCGAQLNITTKLQGVLKSTNDCQVLLKEGRYNELNANCLRCELRHQYQCIHTMSLHGSDDTVVPS